MKNGTFGRIVIFLVFTAMFCSVYIYCLRRQTKPNRELATSEIVTEKPETKIDETSTILETETESPTEAETETEKQEYIKLTVIATAYCPCEKCCGRYSDGRTATGTVAQSGRTIAVDPSVIPYGSKVQINGHTYVAEDCGGDIKGKRIDIFFNTHPEAVNFGKQELVIFVSKSS